jgi:hypothetical protein
MTAASSSSRRLQKINPPANKPQAQEGGRCRVAPVHCACLLLTAWFLLARLLPKKTRKMKITYSIVAPIYNEKENLPELYHRIKEVMSTRRTLGTHPRGRRLHRRLDRHHPRTGEKG